MSPIWITYCKIESTNANSFHTNPAFPNEAANHGCSTTSIPTTSMTSIQQLSMLSCWPAWILDQESITFGTLRMRPLGLMDMGCHLRRVVKVFLEPLLSLPLACDGRSTACCCCCSDPSSLMLDSSAISFKFTCPCCTSGVQEQWNEPVDKKWARGNNCPLVSKV
jgi:hypothetical protein